MLWKTESGECFKTLLGHEIGGVRLQFNPDGSRLLSGGTDRTVRIWDWKLGKDLLAFEHSWLTIDVKFSPDGLSIANTYLRPIAACIRNAVPWQ